MFVTKRNWWMFQRGRRILLSPLTVLYFKLQKHFLSLRLNKKFNNKSWKLLTSSAGPGEPASTVWNVVYQWCQLFNCNLTVTRTDGKCRISLLAEQSRAVPPLHLGQTGGNKLSTTKRLWKHQKILTTRFCSACCTTEAGWHSPWWRILPSRELISWS